MKIKANILSHSLEREFSFKKEGLLLHGAFILFWSWVVITFIQKGTFQKYEFLIYVLLVIGLILVQLILFVITAKKAKTIIDQRIIGTLECTPTYLILNIPKKEIWIDENFEGRLVLNFKVHKNKSIQSALIHQLVIVTTQKTEIYYFALEQYKQKNILDFIKMIDEMNIHYRESIGGKVA